MKQGSYISFTEEVLNQTGEQKFTENFSGILRRTRAANGEITTTSSVGPEHGIDLPFILQMARAKVAGNDLDDAIRHTITGLYIGMSLSRKRSATGLPLDSPITEKE